MKRSAWFVGFVLTYFIAPGSAWSSDCRIRDFLVKDISKINQNAETELSFVLTSSQEEFDNAKKSGAVDGAYKLISGSANWSEARERARRIAEATYFDYKSSYALNYFSQTVWPGAVESYKACLAAQRETPGLTMWLDKREGDYFTFQGFWVGSDVQRPAATLTAAIVDGGRIVAKPDNWLKAKTEEVVVKREGNNDIFLSLTVGEQKKSFVVVRDPPKVIWREHLVTSPKTLSVATADRNPHCDPGTDSDVLYATEPGGFFVKGSEDFSERTSDASRFSKTLVYSPQKITVSITQRTGACENVQSASGQLKALERYPAAGAP